MIEETVQVTQVKTTLTTLEGEGLDLLNWALTEPGVYATISARVDGSLYFEVGGPDPVTTRRAKLGDTIVWDGLQFTVTHPAA